jgi:hypothetical protein
MRRRLATIAAALTLAACSDGLSSPTEVRRSENIDEALTVSQELCLGFASAEIKALIPQCRGQ